MTAPADDWQILRLSRQIWLLQERTSGPDGDLEIDAQERAALGRIIAAHDRGNPKQLLAFGLTFALGIVCGGLIIGAICRF